MNKLLFASAAFVAVGSASASAADLGGRMPMKAPIATSIPSWAGLYIGGNVGYGWGNGQTDASPLPNPASFTPLAPTSLDTKPKGALGGAQIGYNWQMGSFVTGLEADIQGSGIKGSATKTPVLDNQGVLQAFHVLSSEQKLSWFGTLRARLGVTVTPNLLLYATGGLAYGGVETSALFDVADTAYPAQLSKTKAGWTAGAGAEWMFTRNWSAKLEYLYLDLGNVSAVANPVVPNPPTQASYKWHTQENIVRAGVNYHFN
jgi:outer membrane immunogenic protein